MHSLISPCIALWFNSTTRSAFAFGWLVLSLAWWKGECFWSLTSLKPKTSDTDTTDSLAIFGKSHIPQVLVLAFKRVSLFNIFLTWHFFKKPKHQQYLVATRTPRSLPFVRVPGLHAPGARLPVLSPASDVHALACDLVCSTGRFVRQLQVQQR